MSLVLESAYVDSSENPVIPQDSNIPLKAVEVRGEFIDFVAKIRISQTYINGYDRSIEAKYMFNLDGNSVITGMSMVIGDRVLASKISEKSEARQTYEKAISEKKTTCLLEKMSNGIYKVNVGNVLANQEVKIEFEYLTKLECTDEGGMKFVLPTNISPKYEDDKKTVQDMVASKGTTSSMTYTSSKAPFTFHLELNWKSSNEIVEVKSFTNEIEVKPLENIASSAKGVQITSATAPSNGDFNVFVKTQIRPTVYVNMKGEDTYLMVNHRIPDEYADEGSSGGAEYVIIVDRSGSMSDHFSQWSGNESGQSKTKMDYAKEATELFVQSLPVGSHFNIISFGSESCSLFPQSVEYTEDSKNQALTEIATFDSNMGGTELFQCLSDIFSGQMKSSGTAPAVGLNSAEPPQHQRERIIILMTDGDVGNVDAVTSLIRQYSHVSRLFAIGIGQDVNRFLIEKVAKAANGLSEVLVDNPNIGTVVVKMLDASMKSYYRNPTLRLRRENEEKIVEEDQRDGENNALNKNKVIYPNIFESLFYKIPTKEFLICEALQLSCDYGITGKPFHWDFPMNHSEDNSQENQWIAQLYAADLIRSLEERNANNEFTAKIVRLSVDFSVMNDKTSFVVVDEETKTEKASANPVEVTVPQYSSPPFATLAPAVTGAAFTINNIAVPCPFPAPLQQQQQRLSTPPPDEDEDYDDFESTNKLDSMTMKEEVFELRLETEEREVDSQDGGEEEVGGGEGGEGVLPEIQEIQRDFADKKSADVGEAYDSRSSGPPAQAQSSSFLASWLPGDFGSGGARSAPANRKAAVASSTVLASAEDEVPPPPPAEPAPALSLAAGPPPPSSAPMPMGAPSYQKEAEKMEKKKEAASPGKSAEERMDQLLKFKKVDGSFTFSSESLQITGWKSTDVSSFAAVHQLSEELAFNLWILKWLKSDELKANKKYLLIVRNLEKWLKDQQQKQLMVKPSEDYLVAILVI